MPALLSRSRNVRDIRAIREPFQDREPDIRADPENGIRPGIDNHAETLVAVQPGIAMTTIPCSTAPPERIRLLNVSSPSPAFPISATTA
jgi:hypothetical protein